MVTRLLLLALLAGVPTVAGAMPQSFRVTDVRVVRQGQWHADPNQNKTAAYCARFRLSDHAALRWFARSREVDDRTWREQLDWTQCSASGHLLTADGHRYPWELDQSGRGRIIMSPTVSVYLSGKELPMSQR